MANFAKKILKTRLSTTYSGCAIRCFILLCSLLGFSLDDDNAIGSFSKFINGAKNKFDQKTERPDDFEKPEKMALTVYEDFDEERNPEANLSDSSEAVSR